MKKDIINLSVVTFNAVWGDKEKNLNRIIGYIECAARKGSHFVVFPEMSLTGYDDESEKEKKDKMQSLLDQQQRLNLSTNRQNEKLLDTTTNNTPSQDDSPSQNDDTDVLKPTESKSKGEETKTLKKGLFGWLRR